MKKSLWFCLIITFVVEATFVSAQEKAPLGNGNFVLKLDHITFTDSHFDVAGIEKNGSYIGLEGYGKITPNLYLGGEIGIGTMVLELVFIPIELNLKYAMEAARNFVVDFGTGISYSFVEAGESGSFNYFGAPVVTAPENRSDWLFGGQVFAGLTYKINWFSIGVQGKYQITEAYKDASINLSNYRLGVSLGLVF
jgi:hypothetical protein